MSWSGNYSDYLLQQGNENFADSKDTKDSQSSQQTDSSQEVSEHLSGSPAKSGPLDFGTKHNFSSLFVSEKGLVHIYI